VIEARELTKTYGSFDALRDATFAALPERVTGLLGHNGAGKTTCLRMLTGDLAPTAGSASVAGRDVLAHPLAARAAAGYLPESAPSYPEMRVESYLRHRAALDRVPPKRRAAAVDRAIERCWLGEVRRQRIGQLSKGFRQRVGLAGAILSDPPVIILDEPASGLDPAQIVETRKLMRELASDKTVLLSSHILSDVEAACDDVVVLARGRVRAAGPMREIAERHAAKPALIAEVRADPETAAALARDLPGSSLIAAENAGEWTRLTVRTGDDAREAFAATARERGVPLRELTLERSSLERVFLELLQPPTEETPEQEAAA
jgi:ABC-2 type transport system ATP-binding protein